MMFQVRKALGGGGCKGRLSRRMRGVSRQEEMKRMSVLLFLVTPTCYHLKGNNLSLEDIYRVL